MTRTGNFSENVVVPPVDITFVPGAAGLGSFWDPIVQRLPSTWNKRAVDLPGLGPVPPRADIESYGQLVDHVARAINKPTVLVGQSMGGFIALKLALRYPELVRRLVLVVAAGGVDMKRLGAHDWRAQDRAENPSRPAWAHAQTVDLSSELHRIEVPALLVWATRDVLSPLSVAERMAAKLPKARLITFDTDDHWVARRFADETAKAIHDFVLEPDAPPVAQAAAPAAASTQATAPATAAPAVARPEAVSPSPASPEIATPEAAAPTANVAQTDVSKNDVPTNEGPLTE